MCEYCNIDNPKPINNAGLFGEFDIKLELAHDNDNLDSKYYYIAIDCEGMRDSVYTSFEIVFCPMCGRKLKEDVE